MKFNEMTIPAILNELGSRIQRERLNRDMTQSELAQKAGVSLRTLQHVEAGRGCTLFSLVGILRALDRLSDLDGFLPEPGISPVQLARMKGHVRQRASGKKQGGGRS